MDTANATKSKHNLTSYCIRLVSLLAIGGLCLMSGRMLLLATAQAAEDQSGPAPISQVAGEPAEQYVVPLPISPPADRIPHHPLESLIAQIRTGKVTESREWVLPLLVSSLAEPVERAGITGYSSRCPDGGGPRTRWGSRVRRGICAADPRYWGPGSAIWMGEPVNQVLIVEDTGGFIKGPNRFDVCTGDDPVAARNIGRRTANYVPLYRVPPTRRWGRKPADWHPPVLTEPQIAENR